MARTVSNATAYAEEYRRKYADYIGQLNEQIRKLKEENAKLEEQAVTGKMFEVMMKAVHENPVVKGAWDKFMMTLRMTGYDNTTK